MGTVFRKLSQPVSTQRKMFGAEMTSQFMPIGLIDLFPTHAPPSTPVKMSDCLTGFSPILQQ